MPTRLRAVAAALVVAFLASPRHAAARQVPAVAIAIVIDGESRGGEIKEEGARLLQRWLATQLSSQGFVILRSDDPAELVGGELLLDNGAARLEVSYKQPSFTFNVLLLPRAKAGQVRLSTIRSGVTLWEKTIKVHSGIPEGNARRDAALKELKQIVLELRPKPGLALRADPFLAGLVELNDVALDEARFLERVRGFAAAARVVSAPLLVELARDPRTTKVPELRLELLRRAVVAEGPRLEPALARALIAEVRAHPAGSPITDLLVEGFQLIGASPGDALAPLLLEAPLEALLAARTRYAFRARRDEIDQRIERLALRAMREAPDFNAGLEIAAGLPLERFHPETRSMLRDELMARITIDSAEADLARLARLFPDRAGDGSEPTHLDQGFLADAARLAAAPEHVRVELYRQYHRCVPRGGASDPLLRALGLEAALERELGQRLATARDASQELEAMRAVYGPRPGPIARRALARGLVAALGPTPRAEQIAKVARRHPDLVELDAEARRTGAARDVASHVFEVALGDGEERLAERFPGLKLERDEVNRRDLSPAALVGPDHDLPKLGAKGYRAWEARKRFRVLFKDGRAFRILISDLGGRYHHGIRPGDRRAQVLETMGGPSATRALMFGREVLSWQGLDGGRSTLFAVIDGDKVAFLYEDDPAVSREVMAALR